MLTRLLPLIHCGLLELHVSTWRHELGDELVAALLTERVLYEAHAATWFPCACGGRRRVVIDDPTTQTLVAICNAQESVCEDALITAADLRQYGLSFARFIEVVRARLAIAGNGAAEKVGSRLHKIGESVGPYGPTDVFVAIAPDEGTVAFFLSLRGTSARGTLVLATTTAFLTEQRMMAHGAGQRVEIARIEERLQLHAGRLVAAPRAAL